MFLTLSYRCKFSSAPVGKLDPQTPVLAQTTQTKSVKEKMAEMKAKDGRSYAECLTLATQRGLREETRRKIPTP